MTLPRPLSPDEILLRPARTHGWRRRVGLPSLRLSISERRLLLCLGDLAVIEGALLLALVAHFGLETLRQHALRSLTWFLTLAVVWCAWAVFFDVYNLARAANSWNSARAAASAAVLAVFTYALIPWLTPAFGAREPLFLFLATSALGMAGWRSLPVPGETPGHQIVRVHSQGRTLYYLGDLYHHVLKAQHPDWAAVWSDAAAARQSRDRLATRALSEDALLIATHIPAPGRLRRLPSSLEWQIARVSIFRPASMTRPL